MRFPPCTDRDHPDVDRPCPACTSVELAADSLAALFHSLRALQVRRDCFAIIEVGERWAYAQVLADRDGALVVEVSSTEATDDGTHSAALTPAEELELGRLRFAPPDDWSPNWYRVFPDPWPWPAPVVAELLVHSLLWVLGTRPDDLHVKTGHAESISVVRDRVGAR